VSNWVNDRVKEGDVIQVQPPQGRFVLSPLDTEVVLFGGGSGITPVISILKTTLVTTRRRVRLIYANRDERSIIFRKELDSLGAKHAERLRLLHRLDDRDGFLRDADVAALVRSPDEGDYYLCGPGPFMDTVERALLAARVAPERIHIERFVSPPDP